MNTQPNIVIGSDHGGFVLKEFVKEALTSRGYLIEDVGTDSETSVDYPDFAKSVARKVAGSDQRGILICSSGNGVAITANKVSGVRAVNAHDPEEARLAREHNDINVLTLGSSRLDLEPALLVVDAFLRTPFAGGRHARRVAQIEAQQTTT